ncbi:DoxX-like family protein [Leptospira gomenensis]|uniref:DoxX-like family protein n=1 Tax=Leptospira gomenensis TaxID=2484974 RepID=A0A5F1Y6G6_9LEPT|nr:DoxX family protein [Leptospira gomenensis]TGK27561.1 DoxX-like family protein [Leptospira gomenensis]TGK38227.1 DoxX-like family protein [Leptospira gomenensis]TGK42642.1 DoxX-like family protein [Leptospira gomenensis]TGK65805.1 DoxX-like family protein [Leptospira gomenensis]
MSLIEPINKERLLRILSVVVALIFLQTLFFKFTGAAESVAIFTQLQMEPWGRIGSGVAELIVSVLVLIPKRRWIGAVLGLGLMIGAIVSHLFVIGIEQEGDGGLLFFLAVLCALICSFFLWTDKEKLTRILRKFGRK